MKKRITAILLAGSLLGVGGGMFAASAADCAGPVSVDCTDTNPDGSTRHCTVFATDGSTELCLPEDLG